jgi:hypothetical protein
MTHIQPARVLKAFGKGGDYDEKISNYLPGTASVLFPYEGST